MLPLVPVSGERFSTSSGEQRSCLVLLHINEFSGAAVNSHLRKLSTGRRTGNLASEIGCLLESHEASAGVEQPVICPS